MMKPHFLFFLIALPCVSQASVTALFGDNEVVFIVQGQDDDALLLFNSMNVPATESGNGLVEKAIVRRTREGEIFKLGCKYSQLTNTGACSLKLKSSSETLVNTETRGVLMGINNQVDAPHFAKKFNNFSTTPYQSEVFLSSEQKLKIWKTYQHSGEVVSFTLTYQD